jgi:hypothetical protein
VIAIRDGLEFAGRAALQLGWNGLETAAGRLRSGAIPGDVAAVTPAWLTRALQPCAEGVVVSRVDAAGLESGTTARARLALRFEGPGRRADLPSAMFVKLAPQGLRTRLFVGLLGLGRSEVAFYRTARPGLPVRAPRVYFAAAARRGTRFALLLEDLAASGCRFADLTTPSDPAGPRHACRRSPSSTPRSGRAAPAETSPGRAARRRTRLPRRRVPLRRLAAARVLQRFGELVPDEARRPRAS